MYLAFYDENNIFLTPEVTEEVRSEAHALKRILEPKFNNFIPEQDYALFSSGKSELPQSMATQFEEYLNFILNKVNNWEAYRNAYSYRRLVIIDYEEGEPTPIWFCIPDTQKMELYTPPATEPALEEPAQPPTESLEGVAVISQTESVTYTTQTDIGNFTLNQAIELIKQKAAAAQQAAEINEKLQHYQAEIAGLEDRKAALMQQVEELKQQFAELPSAEEYAAISQFASTLSQLIPQQ